MAARVMQPLDRSLYVANRHVNVAQFTGYLYM